MTYDLDHKPTNDREEALWYESEFKRASNAAASLRRERDEIEKNTREIIAAMVEAVGGEVRIPHRLIVDPPELLMVEDPLDDSWRVFRTRRRATT